MGVMSAIHHTLKYDSQRCGEPYCAPVQPLRETECCSTRIPLESTITLLLPSHHAENRFSEPG